MSALQVQLKNILAPWDSCGASPPVKSSRHFSAGPGDSARHDAGVEAEFTRETTTETPLGGVSVPVSFLSPASSGEAAGFNFNPSLRSPRAALTKVELARAALAVFTSNAGMYRPFLQKVLSFLFAYVDYLVEERAELRMRESVVQGPGNAGSSSAVEEEDVESNEAVAGAYQKVRMVEGRMAALVEEASAQRDRFKEQIAAHQLQETKLEGLLMHQLELTHILYDDNGNPMGTGAVSGTQKDPAYVRRLIMRAEKEKALEELEEKAHALAQEQSRLQQHVAGLQKLNSRYARQAVELSARLSIIHDHNTALVTDLQLYQRDLVKEKHRSAKLARDLAAAHTMLLTLMEAQSREQMFAAASRSVGRGMRPGKKIRAVLYAATGGDPDGAAPRRQPASRTQQATKLTSPIAASKDPAGGDGDRGKRGGPDTLNEEEAPSQGALSSASSSASDYEATDKVRDALAVVQDTVLRRQLQGILAVNDAADGGATKSTLLSILNLKRASRAQLINVMKKQDKEGATGGGNGAAATEGLTMGGAEFKQHLWASPLGRSVDIPRHLRSHLCVPLLNLHPLVAECLVHEIMTQRQEVMEYAWREALDASASSTATATAQRTSITTQAVSQVRRTPRPMPLDEFVELFVNVVWLNREERLVPLLPENVRVTLQAERERERQKGHGANSLQRQLEDDNILHHTSHTRANGDTVISNVVKWELHCLIHSLRPPEEVMRLPAEGLKLTYSLDAASRQSDAGFLSYAYGLASRGELSEVVFDVFRSDRKAFLAMCEWADLQIAEARELRRAKERQELYKKRQAEGMEVSEEAAQEYLRVRPAKPSGCLPTVQLARLLTSLYPTYPPLKMEQLVVAATEDGTDSIGNPTIVYYTVLLPERLLPGSAASALEAGVFWRGGAFATLFFNSICDDMLESLRTVEDSILSFAHNRGGLRKVPEPGRAGGGAATALGVGAPGSVLDTGIASVTVTARQLTTLALQAVPEEDMQYWGLPLKSVIYKWRRLRVATNLTAISALSNLGLASAAPAGAAQMTTAMVDPVSVAQRSSSILGLAAPSGTEAGSAPMAARVPVLDVMPYFRRTLGLRRGTHSGAFYHAQAGAEAEEEGSRAAPPAAPEWPAAHAEYIGTLQRRWGQCMAEGAIPLQTTAAVFVEAVRRIDQRREAVWGSEEAGEDNPVLRMAERPELNDELASGTVANTGRGLGPGRADHPHSPSNASPLRRVGDLAG